MPSSMENVMERMRREGAAALASIEAANHDDMVDTVTMAANEARRASAGSRHPYSVSLEATVRRLPPIIDDPFVPTPEQGEALERIAQLNKLIGLRGFGSKRKALEQRLAKLMAELPANALPDEPRLARRPAITEMRVLDPAQAGAPGGTITTTSLNQGTVCVEQTYPPAPNHQPVTPPVENPTRVAGEPTVQVRGAIDGRPLTIRRSVQDDFIALLRSSRA